MGFRLGERRRGRVHVGLESEGVVGDGCGSEGSGSGRVDIDTALGTHTLDVPSRINQQEIELRRYGWVTMSNGESTIGVDW